MVKKKDNLWSCEICGFKYKKENLAKKCESWCRKNKSCNMEITKFAVR